MGLIRRGFTSMEDTFIDNVMTGLAAICLIFAVPVLLILSPLWMIGWLARKAMPNLLDDLLD